MEIDSQVSKQKQKFKEAEEWRICEPWLQFGSHVRRIQKDLTSS